MRIVNGIVQSIALGKSKVKGEKEVMFRVKEADSDVIWFPRVSFSSTKINADGNANNGKTMCDVSTTRIAKVLGVDSTLKAVAEGLVKLESAKVQVLVGTRTNPETGVDVEDANSIVFAGEKPPSMAVDEWVA